MYSIKQILEESSDTGNSLDTVDQEEVPQWYTKVKCKVADIKDAQQDFKRLTVDDWLEHCRQYTVNGIPWEDTHGLEIIKRLIERYKKGLTVFPILVDKDFTVIDGTHRLVALNSLGIEETEVYYPAE